jgi:hypothetical protein
LNLAEEAKSELQEIAKGCAGETTAPVKEYHDPTLQHSAGS